MICRPGLLSHSKIHPNIFAHVGFKPHPTCRCQSRKRKTALLSTWNAFSIRLVWPSVIILSGQKLSLAYYRTFAFNEPLCYFLHTIHSQWSAISVQAWTWSTVPGPRSQEPRIQQHLSLPWRCWAWAPSSSSWCWSWSWSSTWLWLCSRTAGGGERKRRGCFGWWRWGSRSKRSRSLILPWAATTSSSLRPSWWADPPCQDQDPRRPPPAPGGCRQPSPSLRELGPGMIWGLCSSTGWSTSQDSYLQLYGKRSFSEKEEYMPPQRINALI